MEALLTKFPSVREIAPIDWVRVEEELGIVIPGPCRALVEIYGEARFGDFISVLLPKSENEDLDLVRRTKTMWWAVEESDDEDDAGFLREHGLEIRDLVAWGVTGNGDFCLAVNPSKRSGLTIVCNPRESDWESYRVDPGDFLEQTLGGDLTCSVFPVSFPADAPTFYYL